MEDIILIKVWKRIVFVSAVIAFCSIGKAWAIPSNDLLAAMEAGTCDPNAVRLHELALTGDASSQLAFAHAAHKNICGVIELGGEFSSYWYRKSAEQGNATAQAALGKHLVSTWNRANEEESLIWYQRAADQGNLDGKFGLAQLYGSRRNLSKKLPYNNELAMKLYHEAAEQGHERSYFVLSLIYSKGNDGVEKDDVKAAYWFRKSADLGSSFAQSQLAEMYQEGRGVDKSHIEARRWYGKAAAQGSVYAQTDLAKMYRDGRGGPKDEVAALKLFTKSAEEGDSNAQYELGRMYLLGLGGLPKNRDKAELWFAKSAERWHSLAIKELEELESLR